MRTLSEFIENNQEEILARARARVGLRSAPRPTDAELKRGLPLFLRQLVEILNISGEDDRGLQTSATAHGGALSRSGFTIAQVVHDYGDLCQAITGIALEQNAPIATQSFKTLNKCLDDAIASAVTEYARLREVSRNQAETERLGFLAHELRNKLNSAMLAFGILRDGRVGVGGSTGAVLDRSLHGLQDLITRTLAEVRVEAGTQHRERINVRGLVEEIEVEASMTARQRGHHLTVSEVPADVEIDADRQLIAAAFMNLLGNAFKFTPRNGHISLRTQATRDRVLFEIEDECGGLPAGKADELFTPFTQRHADRHGLGLGLPLTRRTVQANGGEVDVRNLPGKGCIFTIRLPRPASGKREVETDQTTEALAR